MNIMNRLAWRSLWKNRTRTLVTIMGIILSAAMFAAVATLGVSLLQYLVDITIYNTGDYFIRFDNATAEEVEAIQAREEISRRKRRSEIFYQTQRSFFYETGL